MSVMELGHLLTRSGLTYLEVSSEVCHDSFCHEAFCLHVVSSSSCIPAVYLEPVLFLFPLQCVNLFCNLSATICATRNNKITSICIKIAQFDMNKTAAVLIIIFVISV